MKSERKGGVSSAEQRNRRSTELEQEKENRAGADMASGAEPAANGAEKENRMGTEKISSLLIRMALPMMISMFVQAMYNIVDSIFVSRINEAALTAVSIAFPVQNLMIAVATGTGVGVNALLSRSLGEKNPEKASRVANTSVFLAGISFLAFLVFGVLGSGWFMRVQTTDTSISQYGTVYLGIVTTLSFGLFGEIMFERLLQSTGRTLMSMVVQLVGAVTNIIFDPILIFGLLGFPKLGIAGAAYATVMGQILAMLLGLILNLRKNPEIRLDVRQILRPEGKQIGEIYLIGFPSILMVSIGSVMTFFINNIVMAFSTTATAVVGVYFKIQSFIFMPVFGLNNGMVPIVAYNYGARRKARIEETLRYAIRYAVMIMLIGFAVFELFPAQLLGLFNASDHMLSIGVPALRIICISFLFAGYCVILGSFFQALGSSMYSLWVSVVRQLLVLVPAAWLLSLTGNLDMVWLAWPIAEIASVVMSTIFLKRIRRTKLNF